MCLISVRSVDREDSFHDLLDLALFIPLSPHATMYTANTSSRNHCAQDTSVHGLYGLTSHVHVYCVNGERRIPLPQ